MRKVIEEAAASFYNRLLSTLGFLAGVLFGAAAVLITFDVIVRNLFRWNIPWLPDFVEYSLFFCAFGAAPWVLRQGAHVRIDILLTTLPPGAARTLARLVDLAGAALSLLFAYYGLLAVIDAWQIGSVQLKTFAIPEWYLLSLIPFSMLLMAVEFLLRFSSGADAGRRTLEEGF